MSNKVFLVGASPETVDLWENERYGLVATADVMGHERPDDIELVHVERSAQLDQVASDLENNVGLPARAIVFAGHAGEFAIRPIWDISEILPEEPCDETDLIVREAINGLRPLSRGSGEINRLLILRVAGVAANDLPREHMGSALNSVNRHLVAWQEPFMSLVACTQEIPVCGSVDSVDGADLDLANLYVNSNTDASGMSYQKQQTIGQISVVAGLLVDEYPGVSAVDRALQIPTR